MSEELNRMIGDIEKGKGDLTCRIKTQTSSELSYIRNGINNFLFFFIIPPVYCYFISFPLFFYELSTL